MDKPVRISFVIAGVISLVFLVFHIFLFQLFNWKETLVSLNRNNWATFQTFNLVAILMIGMITYFSFRHPADLIQTSLGKSLLLVFSLFYLIRIVSQFIFFGYQGVGSLMIVMMCLTPVLIYSWNAFSRPLTNETTPRASRKPVK